MELAGSALRRLWLALRLHKLRCGAVPEHDLTACCVQKLAASLLERLEHEFPIPAAAKKIDPTDWAVHSLYHFHSRERLRVHHTLQWRAQFLLPCEKFQRWNTAASLRAGTHFLVCFCLTTHDVNQVEFEVGSDNSYSVQRRMGLCRLYEMMLVSPESCAVNHMTSDTDLGGQLHVRSGYNCTSWW